MHSRDPGRETNWCVASLLPSWPGVPQEGSRGSYRCAQEPVLADLGSLLGSFSILGEQISENTHYEALIHHHIPIIMMQIETNSVVWKTVLITQNSYMQFHLTNLGFIDNGIWHSATIFVFVVVLLAFLKNKCVFIKNGVFIIKTHRPLGGPGAPMGAQFGIIGHHVKITEH